MGEIFIAQPVDKDRKADVIIRLSLPQRGSKAMKTQIFVAVYHGVPLLWRELSKRGSAFGRILGKQRPYELARSLIFGFQTTIPWAKGPLPGLRHRLEQGGADEIGPGT